MSRWGIIWNQGACIGCNACQIACKDRHNLEPGMNFRRVDTVMYIEDGVQKYAHVSASCQHCEDAACLNACPFGALNRTEEGFVVVDESLCRGCGACERSCAYGAVFVSERTHVAKKCDGCSELRSQGRQPACVEACITHCLEFRELTAEDVESPLASKLKESFHINPKRPSGRKAKEKGISECRIEPVNHSRNELEEMLKELAGFFEGREQAIGHCRKQNDWSSHTEEEWRLEYDFLFRGTDADWSIPLWASVAAGDPVLLNQTTLDVIRFYHKYGYEPVWMEGNPPDYIGEQMQFLVNMELLRNLLKNIRFRP